ncbi:MAG: methyltransferase domain-containing protein [Hyphomicrobiaceae bacterium]|nr:methyltransferase domain-containing protein [Hyphomicrobiaceae bacterium]
MDAAIHNDLTMIDIDAVVVGAGQAGVCLSYFLTKKAVRHVVLERDRAFSAWHNRWDGFRANTPNWLNTLPMGQKFPVQERNPDGFATREELTAYFSSCLEQASLPLSENCDVQAIEQLLDGRWLVTTAAALYRTPNVGLCTGAMAEPRLPACASALTDVHQLHSSRFRSPSQIKTETVLVVGSASSGMQITEILAGSGRFKAVHLATSNVLVLPERVLGIQIHRLLHMTGLLDLRTRSLLGRMMYATLETRGDPIRHPTPTDLAKRYGVILHGKLVAADAGRVDFSGNESLSTDSLTVLWCTGLQPNYDIVRLSHPGPLLDRHQLPIHERGIAKQAPGLYFVGLRYQHTVASHDIYGVGRDAEYVANEIETRVTRSRLDEAPMALAPAACGVCGVTSATRIGCGYDFEYRTSLCEFNAYRCDDCGTVFLNPRPDVSEFERIYPPTYHSLDYSTRKPSFVSRVRSHLEAQRLLRYCRGLPDAARIIDVGCGDGFHLKLLAQHGAATWRLEGIDIDRRAIGGSPSQIVFHQGTLETVELPAASYDLALTIQTIEHVAAPSEMLRSVSRLLKPGGKLVIVTDNTGSIDFSLFRRRYWGGYHFPRHWNLFNAASLTRLANKTGFDVVEMQTIVSPVNWVYSFHCMLVDKGAPRWLINQFSLKSPPSLAVFTLVDMAFQLFGRGALLNAVLVKRS